MTTKRKFCTLALLALVILSLTCGTCGESAESQRMEDAAAQGAAIRATMGAWEAGRQAEALATQEAVDRANREACKKAGYH